MAHQPWPDSEDLFVREGVDFPRLQVGCGAIGAKNQPLPVRYRDDYGHAHSCAPSLV